MSVDEAREFFGTGEARMPAPPSPRRSETAFKPTCAGTRPRRARAPMTHPLMIFPTQCTLNCPRGASVGRHSHPEHSGCRINGVLLDYWVPANKPGG